RHRAPAPSRSPPGGSEGIRPEEPRGGAPRPRDSRSDGGGVYVSPSVATTVARVSLAKTDVPLDRLTRRDRQGLHLIAGDKKTEEIAALLGVKFKTAETHRSRIMRRVNIHGTANLVRYALRGGLTRL